MAERSEIETTVRKLREDGRRYFRPHDLWRHRLYEWLLPVLWGLMPIVALVVWIWAVARG